jgi:hypothetical protein
VDKAGGRVVAVDHVGSAHDDASLALLLEAAEALLHAGQEPLEVDPAWSFPGLGAVADWTAAGSLAPALGPGRPRSSSGGVRVVASPSVLLWRVLAGAWRAVGFDALGDDVFAAVALARIAEPTSKADSLRVLAELGVDPPALRSVFRMLARCEERGYRDVLAGLCQARFAAAGRAAFVMCDVTTLHFEIDDEDGLRRGGLDKQHRADPLVQVGLLVGPSGFPLEARVFEGNKAETLTIVPVISEFRARHGVEDVAVVADAGMLSAANLNALEDAGYQFIVGSRITKAPYDLADHFAEHGDYFADGQILESKRAMGRGKAARERRVVYQWLFKRAKRDNQTINKQIDRAERAISGESPTKALKFLAARGAEKPLNQTTIDRARQLAGLKGYVTNVPEDQLSGLAVIGAYHELYHVEESFRMSKHDLRARPVHHHTRRNIDAHVTIVFAALAASRHLQQATGLTINKLVKLLRPLRSAALDVNGHRLLADPQISPQTRDLLAHIEAATGH